MIRSCNAFLQPDKRFVASGVLSGVVISILQHGHLAKLEAGSGMVAIPHTLAQARVSALPGSRCLDGDIQGRHFNKIVGELRRQGKRHQEQILQWMMSLHGHLLSPTGGEVRHGVDVNKGRELEIDEARLCCNLIRSYLTFLIAGHERLTRCAVETWSPECSCLS